MTRDANVTVAVCTYRRYAGAVRALQSLQQQSFTEHFRVVVIDNAPAHPDSAVSIFEEFLPAEFQPEVIVEPALGVSFARNRALAACSSDLIAYLDDDCVATPSWLAALTATYEKSGPAIGAVGGKVKACFDSDCPKWMSRSLLGYLSIVDWSEQTTQVTPPQWLSGGNILYSVKALNEVGGFKGYLGRRGDMLLSNEELEACISLNYHKYRILYEPSAVVTHAIPSSRLTQDWFRRRLLWQAISDILMTSTNDECNVPIRRRFLNDADPNTRLADLTRPVDTAVEFNRQLGTIYEMIRLLASKGSIPNSGS